MRRVIQVITTALPVAILAACASPTAPFQAACITGKVPTASCERPNRDYVNPLGDYVNPLGDYVNPLGDYVNPLGDYVNPLGNIVTPGA